jgi:hypothetical protein
MLKRLDTNLTCPLWVPKMPSKGFRPEFHKIDEFKFDSAFVWNKT